MAARTGLIEWLVEQEDLLRMVSEFVGGDAQAACQLLGIVPAAWRRDGVLPDAPDGLLVGVPDSAFEVGVAGDAATSLPLGRALDGRLHRDRTAEVVGGDASAAPPASHTPASNEGGRGRVEQAGAGRGEGR